MKVIMIEEKRFAEILELMSAKVTDLGESSNTPERCGWSREMWKAAINEAHRTMHYYFVRWAQGEGASCVPK